MREATIPIFRTLLALSPPPTEVQTKGHIVIPNTQGLCESIKKVCSKYGIQTHFKGNSTIKTSWFSPRIRTNKSGAIYWFQCRDLACDEEYIGETSRTFGERFREHLKEPFPIHNHSCTTGHTTTHDNFQIIGREDHGTARIIKESIYIRVNNSTLNRNIGKFNLHRIWNTILLNTPGLKINRYVQGPPPIGHAQSAQPNTPMHIFTGSMEHTQRTPLSENVHRTS